MKRRLTRIAATFMAVLLLFGTFGILSVSAAVFDDIRTYNIYRTDSSKMTIDAIVGENEPWDKVEWSEQLRKYYQNGSANLDGYTISETPGHFKALWANDSSSAYLYFLIELDDPDGAYTQSNGQDNWQCDVFQVFVDEKGESHTAVPVGGAAGNGNTNRRTGSLYTKPSDSVNQCGDWFEYIVKREGTTVTIEGKYIFSNPSYAKENGNIKFEVISQRCNGSVYVDQYSWCNNCQDPNAFDKCGIGVLNAAYAADIGSVVDDEDDVLFCNNGIAIGSANKDSGGYVELPKVASGMNVCAWKNIKDGKIYAAGSKIEVGDEQIKLDAMFIRLSLADGARIRLSGAAALKFNGTVDSFDSVGEYLTKTGIIFVEKSLLTEELLAKGVTPAVLTEAGVDFVKSENDAAAVFEGVIDNISDKDKVYSAIPYAVVKMSDNSEVECAGNYSEENNARSITMVATAAYNDRTLIKKGDNQFKAGTEFGIAGFEAISYSPYTMEQLAFIKEIIG